MAIFKPAELIEKLGKDERILGLDVGSKTIGLALSDVTHTIATPLETIDRKKFKGDAEKLNHIITSQEVGALIVGLPVQMDGTEGPRCQATREFIREFKKINDLPVAYWDERLSTSAVERVLINDLDMTRKRRKQVIDRAAAAYILQGALDHIKIELTPKKWER